MKVLSLVFKNQYISSSRTTDLFYSLNMSSLYQWNTICGKRSFLFHLKKSATENRPLLTRLLEIILHQFQCVSISSDDSKTAILSWKTRICEVNRKSLQTQNWRHCSTQINFKCLRIIVKHLKSMEVNQKQGIGRITNWNQETSIGAFSNVNCLFNGKKARFF